MKRVGLLILWITGIMVITGCGSIEFEEATIDGFVIDVEVERIIDQGESELAEDELAELVPAFATEMESVDLVLSLELVSAEFEHELSAQELAASDELSFMMSQAVDVNTQGQAQFAEITFAHAGQFEYLITQSANIAGVAGDGLGWVIDDLEISITVIVTEDEEYEMLRGSVEFHGESSFTNKFIESVEDEVTALLTAQLEQMHDELEVLLEEKVDEVFGRVGISYYCLTTGRHIAINGSTDFNSASTRKLATHMIIAQNVQDGHLSWDEDLTYTSGHFAEGSGELQYTARIGDTFSVRELVEYSITISDNIAHEILLSTITASEREQFERDVFGDNMPNEQIVGGWVMTPNWLTEIFKVLYQDQDEIDEYEVILQYKMNTSWTDRFATELADGYVAHTPGWSFEYSHDSGIFFTDFPYVLVIMTADVPSAMTWDPDPEVPNFISEVSDMVLEMHLEFQ